MMHYHRSVFKLIPNVTIKEYMNSLLQRNHTLPCIAMKLNKLQFKLHRSAGLITECLVKVSFASSSQQGFLFSARFPFKQQLVVVWFSTSSSCQSCKIYFDTLQLWQQQTQNRGKHCLLELHHSCCAFLAHTYTQV